MSLDLQGIGKSLRNNRGLKAVALLLAVITWYTVREITSFTTVVQDVRLDVLLDPGWAVLDRSVDEVDVLFRGSQSDIRFLNRDQIRVEVDLRGRSVAGAREVRLGPGNVRSPGGVARPVSVDPSEITLTLDREGEKQVPLKAEVIGNPPVGYEVERVVATPATVTLQGPQGRLAGIEELRTAPIDLEGRMQSFALTRVVQPPSETWTARVEPDRARVDVTLVARSAAKEIAGVRLQLLVSPNTPPIEMSAQAVNLALTARPDVVGSLDASNLTAFVDCTGLHPGESLDLPVQVPLPPGVALVSVDPDHVRVEMAKP